MILRFSNTLSFFSIFVLFVCFSDCLPSQQPGKFKVYARDGSVQTCLRTTVPNERCRWNLLSHSDTAYWPLANQSCHWYHNVRRLAGKPRVYQFWFHWYDTAPDRTPVLPQSRGRQWIIEADNGHRSHSGYVHFCWYGIFFFFHRWEHGIWIAYTLAYWRRKDHHAPPPPPPQKKKKKRKQKQKRKTLTKKKQKQKQNRLW